jgi:hypothetical protein
MEERKNILIMEKGFSEANGGGRLARSTVRERAAGEIIAKKYKELV